MTRSIRRRQWHGVLVGGLLLLTAPTSTWAQTNTFPLNGNAGIGTTTPTAPLTIRASGSAPPVQSLSSPLLTMGSWDGVGNSSLQLVGALRGLILLGGQAASGAIQGVGTIKFLSGQRSQTDENVAQVANISATTTDGTSTSGGLLSFFARPTGGALTEVVRMDSSGNVGIGTLIPAAKLHVAGDAQVDGNLAAKYQDIAEWVQSPIPLQSGVVVVVDPQTRNHVLPASAPYDTRVAGVVSSRPGLLLGEAGDGKVKVAHSGRVKVKADATYGPIATGDLLVTSPTSGHAMRSVPVELAGASMHRPGTLLGKALEPLETGVGEILMLLTLQ